MTREELLESLPASFRQQGQLDWDQTALALEEIGRLQRLVRVLVAVLIVCLVALAVSSGSCALVPSNVEYRVDASSARRASIGYIDDGDTPRVAYGVGVPWVATRACRVTMRPGLGRHARRS